MIIIAGYGLLAAESRDEHVAAFRDLVTRAATSTDAISSP